MHTAYFDNSATSFPKPQEVYDAMDNVIREYGVNADRGGYSLARKTGTLIQNARTSMTELVGIHDSQNVIFTPSATIALNTVLLGLDWENGDTVFITPFEHNGVLRPLYHLRESFGIRIKEIPVERNNLEFDLDALEEAFIKHNPKLVVVNHGSNVCGVVAPLTHIAEMAKRYGALVLVDTAQTIGCIDIDMVEQQLDFLVFAGHKNLYGPIGIGGVVINSNIRLRPLFYGGTGNDSESEYMPLEYPSRLEAGSPNIGAIAGLAAGLEFVKDNAQIREHEQALFNLLLDELDNYPEITVFASRNSESRLPVVSCTVAGYTPQEFATVLDRHFGIAVRAGLHCAPVAHKFLGTAPLGTVRFSIGAFNTLKDIEAVVQALDQLFY